MAFISPTWGCWCQWAHKHTGQMPHSGQIGLVHILDLFLVIEEVSSFRHNVCLKCFAHVFALMIFCDRACWHAPNRSDKRPAQTRQPIGGLWASFEAVTATCGFSRPSIAPLHKHCAISCQNRHCYVREMASIQYGLEAILLTNIV